MIKSENLNGLVWGKLTPESPRIDGVKAMGFSPSDIPDKKKREFTIESTALSHASPYGKSSLM